MMMVLAETAATSLLLLPTLFYLSPHFLVLLASNLNYLKIFCIYTIFLWSTVDGATLFSSVFYNDNQVKALRLFKQPWAFLKCTQTTGPDS